jgi:hypothetical protein
MRTYSLTISTTHGLPIGADKVEQALAETGDLGPDVDIWEVEPNSFRLETDEPIDTQLLCHRLEALANVESCRARLELSV